MKSVLWFLLQIWENKIYQSQCLLPGDMLDNQQKWYCWITIFLDSYPYFSARFHNLVISQSPASYLHKYSNWFKYHLFISIFWSEVKAIHRLLTKLQSARYSSLLDQLPYSVYIWSYLSRDTRYTVVYQIHLQSQRDRYHTRGDILSASQTMSVSLRRAGRSKPNLLGFRSPHWEKNLIWHIFLNRLGI